MSSRLASMAAIYSFDRRFLLRNQETRCPRKVQYVFPSHKLITEVSRPPTRTQEGPWCPAVTRPIRQGTGYGKQEGQMGE